MSELLHIEKGPYTPQEIEKVYADLMASNFYDEEYNRAEWNPDPYRAMSLILAEVFEVPVVGGRSKGFTHLRKLIRKILGRAIPTFLDLGCGVGYLVAGLRELTVASSRGVEFSPKIFGRIDQKTRNFVKLLSPEAFMGQFSLASFDVITALEVFEHLPLSIIRMDLAKIREEFRGYLFLTIPSSGQDPYSQRQVFGEGSPFRREDMRRNRPLRIESLRAQ